MTQISPDKVRPRPQGLGSILAIGVLLVCLAGFLAVAAAFCLGGFSAFAAAVPAEKPVKAGVVALELAADRTKVLQGDGLVRLELTLRGVPSERKLERLPTDFIVVLDRSGSMGGDKIEKAREAVKGLIDRLCADDRFGLVIYDDRVEVPIPLLKADFEQRSAWKRLVDQIEPRGSTAISDGLDQGLALLARRKGPGIARMVLISDGLANHGDTSRDGLLGRARRSAEKATPLTAIGVGVDFDESLMGSLAEDGAGNFYFLENPTALAQVFEGELGATQETVADALTIAFETAPGVTIVDAAGYPVERLGKRTLFRPGSLFAGQERRLWLTLRVEDQRLGAHELAKIQATFRAQGLEAATAEIKAASVEMVADEDIFIAGLDRDRWGRSVIEEEYGQLQKQVAEHVKAGRRDLAKQEIAAYRSKNARVNASVQCIKVEANLAASVELERKVEDAFTGADQALKQNSLSKANQASSWDSRRQGAKKLPNPGGN
jgi:Ca-activated chloride channel homolog